MEIPTQPPSLVIRPEDIVTFDRGNGVRTLPGVGRWNSTGTTLTTGVTEFAPGTRLALHWHNVEESVHVLAGHGRIDIDGVITDVGAGDFTWVPAGVSHGFRNLGTDVLRILWVYGGRDVTRTITATGQTVAHLSPADRHGERA